MITTTTTPDNPEDPFLKRFIASCKDQLHNGIKYDWVWKGSFNDGAEDSVPVRPRPIKPIGRR